MAATLFAALVGFIFFTNIYPALDESNCSPGSLTYPENTGSLFQSRLESLLHFIARVRFASSSQRRIRRAIVAWKNRGLTFLAAPEKSILLNITIYCDIELNPGPELLSMAAANLTKESNCHSCNDILPSEHRLVQRIVISRDTLLSHRKFGWKPPMEAMITCKALGILKYRGKRGGQCRRQHACCLNRQEQNISVVTGNGEGTDKMRVKPLAGERPPSNVTANFQCT